jgi:hypothetical protein
MSAPVDEATDGDEVEAVAAFVAWWASMPRRDLVPYDGMGGHGRVGRLAFLAGRASAAPQPPDRARVDEP